MIVDVSAGGGIEWRYRAPRNHGRTANPQHINAPQTSQRPATGTPAAQPSSPTDQTGNRTTTSEPVRTETGTPSATSHGTTTEPRNSDNPLTPSPSAAGWPTTPTTRVEDQNGKCKPKTDPVHKGIRHQPSMQPQPHRKPQHINNPPAPRRPAADAPAAQPPSPTDRIGNRATTSEPVHAGIGTHPAAETVHANQVSASASAAISPLLPTLRHPSASVEGYGIHATGFPRSDNT